MGMSRLNIDGCYAYATIVYMGFMDYASRSRRISLRVVYERGLLPTSSKGLVSLKQLSKTSLTASSACSLPEHAGFAITDSTALRLTQA